MIVNAVTFIPDPGEPVPTTVTNTPAPVELDWLDRATGWLDAVPAWAWLAGVVVLFAVLLVLRVKLEKAYRVNPPKSGDKLGGLFYAAVIFATILWAGILLASGKNLVGWAKDTLHWTDGWEYLIPAGLDGIAVAFAVVMFAAVRQGRPANRAYRIVWSSTLMSAGIGFSHGYDGTAGSIAAAAVLAYFALAAMAVLHELLDLFRSTTSKKAPRIRPPFGLRWFTYFPNTVCAALAWENHPPRPLPTDADDDQIAWYGSVRHAVAHLETVRRAKRIAQFRIDEQTRATGAPVWLVKVPAVRKLTATITVQQAEMAEMTDRLSKVAADFAAEKVRADAAVNRAEEQARNAARAFAEKTVAEGKTADALRQAEKVRADAEAEMNRLREQATTTVHRTESIAERRVTTAQAELTHTAARLDKVEQQWIAAKQEAGVLSAKLTEAQAETHSARLSAERAEKTAAALRSALTESAEKHSTELAENTARLRTEMAENEERIRAEMATVNLSDWRGGERRKPSTAQRRTPAENTSVASNAPRMTDEEAVQALFSADMNPHRVWKQDDVRAITQAGYGRIPRLLSALAEYHRTPEAEKRRRAAESPAVETAEKPTGESGGEPTAESGEDTEIARPVAHAG